MNIHELVNIPRSASDRELDHAFELWRTEIEHKVSSAPTPALKAKLRKKLRDAEDSFAHLHLGANQELPSTSATNPAGVGSCACTGRIHDPVEVVSAALMHEDWKVGDSDFSDFRCDVRATRNHNIIRHNFFAKTSQDPLTSSSEITLILNEYESLEREFKRLTNLFGKQKTFILAYVFDGIHQSLEDIIQKQTQKNPFPHGWHAFPPKGFLWVFDQSSQRFFGALPNVTPGMSKQEVPNRASITNLNEGLVRGFKR